MPIKLTQKTGVLYVFLPIMSVIVEFVVTKELSQFRKRCMYDVTILEGLKEHSAIRS